MKRGRVTQLLRWPSRNRRKSRDSRSGGCVGAWWIKNLWGSWWKLWDTHRCRMNRAANFTRVREHRRDTSVMRIAKFSYSQGCGWRNSECRYYKYRKNVAPPGNRPSLSRFFSRISGRGSNHIWQHHRILLMYPINLVSYSEFHLFWLSHLAKAASTCGR